MKHITFAFLLFFATPNVNAQFWQGFLSGVLQGTQRIVQQRQQQRIYQERRRQQELKRQEELKRQKETDATSDNISSESQELRYKGIYTISSQGRDQTTGGYTGVAGPDFETEIEIYDDYIVVSGTKCKFSRTYNGERVYKSTGLSFGDITNQDSYYVDKFYNIRKVSTLSSNLGTNWFEYNVTKGRCTMPKQQPTYEGSISQGHSGTIINGQGQQKSTGSSKSRIACKSCMYTNGKCPVCRGTRYKTSSSMGVKTSVACDNCGQTGRCPTCGGDGWID